MEGNKYGRIGIIYFARIREILVDLLPLPVVGLLVLLLDDELGVRVGVVDQTDLLLERKQS